MPGNLFPLPPMSSTPSMAHSDMHPDLTTRCRKTITASLRGALLALTLLGTHAAHAHYLWLEPADAGARLYYGEADLLLKERSPGKLDGITSPQGYLQTAAGGSIGAAVTRRAEYFAIAAGTHAAAILAMEESVPVKDLTGHGLGIAKSNYYARHGAAGDGATPLALDIRQRGPNSYVVLYRGQPLKDAKLEVIAPNTWMQEHRTDAQGAVDINTPWRGQYIVHVLHVDATPGEFGGKRYEVLRNHFTYSFIRRDGLDPGPAVPPKHIQD